MTAYVATAGRWTSPPLASDGDETAAWAAETLAAGGRSADALVVATLDSGARESVAFWRASRETGLRFANPRGFPWTLSNSVTGRIAQELGIRGPTYTLVGRTDALVAALEHALDELAAPDVSRVLVTALDANGEDGTRLAALWLARVPAPRMLAAVDALTSGNASGSVGGGTASEALATAIGRIEAGDEAVIGTSRDGRIRLRPLSRG